MRLAIFDIDGTLTDTHGYDRHFFRALESELGVAGIRDALDRWRHVTDEGIAEEVFEVHDREPDADAFERIKADYDAALAADLTAAHPMPGAQGILDFLHGRDDWRIAVATGNWEHAAARKLAAAGVEVGDVPVVGCDGRPSREAVLLHAYDESVRRHGAFEHHVYIGDAAWDVRTCRNLAWNFVGLHGDRERLLGLGATHVLADYLDLERTHTALLEALPPR